MTPLRDVPVPGCKVTLLGSTLSFLRVGEVKLGAVASFSSLLWNKMGCKEMCLGRDG